MGSFLHRVIKYQRGKGPAEVTRDISNRLAQSISNRNMFEEKILRPLVPGEMVTKNGVPIRRAHLLSDNADDPHYEEAIITALRNSVETSDDVVIVGGGNGVSTVTAAEKAGPDGSVTVFEASEEKVTKVRSVAAVNNVSDRVEVVHAYIAEAIDTFGDLGDADCIDPDSLPECDVLVLDCEGAESTIIQEISIRPRIMIVESHGMFDSGPTRVRELLKNQDFQITSEEFAVSSDERREFCEENGIYVFAAIRNGS